MKELRIIITGLVNEATSEEVADAIRTINAYLTYKDFRAEVIDVEPVTIEGGL